MSYKGRKNKYKPPYRHWFVDRNLILKGFGEKFTGNDTAFEKLAGIGASYAKLITLNTELVSPRVFVTGKVSSGKTSAVRELAKLLNVPIITVSAGELTPSGYRGVNFSSALRGLVAAAGSKEQVERFGGIVHIDECDKWILTSSNDKFYENIIYNMFGLLGGEVVQVDNDEFGSDSFQLDTKKVMVVLSGAFEWLSESSFANSDRAIKTLLRLKFPAEFCSRISSHVHFEKLKSHDVQKVIFGKSLLLSECFKAGKFVPELSRLQIKTITKQVFKNKLGIRSSQRLIEENFLKQASQIKDLTI